MFYDEIVEYLRDCIFLFSTEFGCKIGDVKLFLTSKNTSIIIILDKRCKKLKEKINALSEKMNMLEVTLYFTRNAV